MKSAIFGRRNRDGQSNQGSGFGRSESDKDAGSGKTERKESEQEETPSSLAISYDPGSAESGDEDLAHQDLASRPEGNEYGDVQSVDDLLERVEDVLTAEHPPELARGKSQSDLIDDIRNAIERVATDSGFSPSDGEKNDLQTYLLNEFYADAALDESADGKGDKSGPTDVLEARDRIQPLLMEHIDASAASEMARADLGEQVSDVVGELLVQERLNLNLREQRALVTILLDDMLGLGPLEPLLADETINDIMVNGCNQVYIERQGKMELTDVKFRDAQHLFNIATRIVSAVGRRVDETSPICDARLADGSRVNVIIPPLAIDGASISIRKFAKKKITLDVMIDGGSMSKQMGTVLKIAGACQLNVLISGGTGSGKTTMLNAMSRLIDPSERVVTIEDAAELQLQQPHVVRLETRPPNLEGQGEVTMRDLVKNALRMRPDRIILGEIRGSEAIDMLQAMNTGHDGSLGTIHANSPREALTRLENMVGMAGINLPSKAVRTQIADALDMVVQVDRMRDGIRRTVYVTEVIGMEGDVITTQDLFRYRFTGEDEGGKLVGTFESSGLRPHFMERAEYFGLSRALMQAMN